MFPFFTVTGGFWMWGIPSSPFWSFQYNSVTDKILWFLTLSQLWISQTFFIACWIFIMLYFSCGKRQLPSFHFKLIGINWTQHSFYRQQYFWGSFCLPSISSCFMILSLCRTCMGFFNYNYYYQWLSRILFALTAYGFIRSVAGMHSKL